MSIDALPFPGDCDACLDLHRQGKFGARCPKHPLPPETQKLLENPNNLWTTEEAIALAKKVEAICPPFGYHVALTGGLLYKEGPRKDCDLVLYQTGSWTREHDYSRLLDGLSGLGFNFNKPHEYKQRYVYKTTYQGKSVDILFPEFNGPYSEE